VPVNIRDFLDVRVICETGSLRKAATLLGVTQPTLSVRLAHLESQLGEPLFDRSRGKSEPTDLALFIARRTSVMADEAEHLAQEVKRVASGKLGLVKVGVSAVPARSIIPSVAVSISDRFPKVSLEFLTAPTAQLAEDLMQRKLDLLVCPELEMAGRDVESELILETEIVVLANPDHPMRKAPPTSIQGLFKYPIALPITEPHYYDRVKRDYGIDINAIPGRILCSDPSMLAQIVQKSTRHFTAAPRYYFAPELQAGLLATINTPIPFGHSIYLHWNRDAYPLPAVKTVEKAIREAFLALRAQT